MYVSHDRLQNNNPSSSSLAGGVKNRKTTANGITAFEGDIGASVFMEQCDELRDIYPVLVRFKDQQLRGAVFLRREVLLLLASAAPRTVPTRSLLKIHHRGIRKEKRAK